MQTAAATNPAGDIFVLTRASPGRAQKLLAVRVIPGILAVVICFSWPSAGMQLRPVDAFVPLFVAAMFVNDLVTAVLLFAQFSILRTRALLVIANGYLFTALMFVPYFLSWPGAFEPGQILLGGPETAAWVYVLQRCGFSVFLCAFALLQDLDVSAPYWHGKARWTIVLSVALTTAVVSAAAFVCFTGEGLLPAIMINKSRFGAAWYYAAVSIVSLHISALVLLWFGRRTVLGLWLMVLMCVYLVGAFLSYFPPPLRFSVGWYTVVVINLFASSLILIVLLAEITMLYGRLLLAVRAQHREREARLVTGDAVAALIAHEVKQPLSAMITRAETALRRLDRTMPDIDKAKEEFRKIANDGHRAGTVIDGVRANFKKDSRARTSLDINSLITETIALVRDDLQNHRILLKAEPNPNLPPVTGDRTQLQQVLLNLITNAIDSMTAKDGPRVLSLSSEVQSDRGVVVSIADTGTGIGSQDVERVFNPLFTTKPNGMGMGLSICRSIIEAHEGQLWVVPNSPQGAVFQFALPDRHGWQDD